MFILVELLDFQFIGKVFVFIFWFFKLVDALITNFHLPQSTLLMLTSAMAGSALLRKSYEIAVDQKYRFYSFGDAMFII